MVCSLRILFILKRTRDQKLSFESMCGQLHTAITLLMLLTFMTIHLIQFRFADVVDARTSVEESPFAAQGTALAMSLPSCLASDCSYMSRNMVQMDGGIAYNVAARTQDTCCKTSRHFCS